MLTHTESRESRLVSVLGKKLMRLNLGIDNVGAEMIMRVTIVTRFLSDWGQRRILVSFQPLLMTIPVSVHPFKYVLSNVIYFSAI